MLVGMRIVTCENPQTIRNPYTNEILRVPCGKCLACKNLHAKYWIDKLEKERRCWTYCYMVTLTFDDNHLPKLFSDGRGNLVDYQNADLCIPFSELDIKSDKDRELFHSRLNHRLGIPYHRTDIVQNFHKRLNKYIHDKITKKYQNFRYFLAEEYGGDTHRPHLHGLYFFNSRQVAQAFREILFTCWRQSDNVLQAVDATAVTGSATSYVAQYINMFDSLPAFYRHRVLKPRYFFSKQPPLGSLQSGEEARETFFRCSPVRVEHDVKRNAFVALPLPYSLRNRLYPKIPRYSEVSLYVRTKAYGLYREFDSWSFKSFLTSLDSRYNDYNHRQLHCRCKSECLNEFQSYLRWLTNDFKFKPSDYLDPADYDSTINRCKRFYYVTARVCNQADVFGISVDNYVSYIDMFYNNLSLSKLAKFYENQSHYSQSSHDVEDCAFMYYSPDDFLEAGQFEYVPDFEQTFAYRDIHATAEKIYRDSTKTHKKNDYLDRCRDKKLSLIMKNYFM